MPGAGHSVPDWFSQQAPQTTPQPAAPTKQYGNPNTYTTAANQQAADYDKIMKMYEDLAKKAQMSPIKPGSVSFQTISPVTNPYTKSADVTNSLSNLSELSRTGGYSDEGIADLRARGVAPVRSIYASAQRNVERQKALSGGYSPNYGAVTAKMAREMSDQIANKLTDVNAGIAQNVASNKIAITPQYASASLRENEDRTGVETHNADTMNDVNKFNATGTSGANTFNANAFMDAQRGNYDNILGAINGMRGLYGTTPALTSLFGQQVSDAAGMNKQQQQLDNQRLSEILRASGSVRT